MTVSSETLSALARTHLSGGRLRAHDTAEDTRTLPIDARAFNTKALYWRFFTNGSKPFFNTLEKTLIHFQFVTALLMWNGAVTCKFVLVLYKNWALLFIDSSSSYHVVGNPTSYLRLLSWLYISSKPVWYLCRIPHDVFQHRLTYWASPNPYTQQSHLWPLDLRSRQKR